MASTLMVNLLIAVAGTTVYALLNSLIEGYFIKHCQILPKNSQHHLEKSDHENAKTTESENLKKDEAKPDKIPSSSISEKDYNKLRKICLILKPDQWIYLTRIIIVVIILIFVSAFSGRIKAQLSVIPEIMEVTYSISHGIPLKGFFKGRGDKSIYLLTKPITSDHNSNEWTTRIEGARIVPGRQEFETGIKISDDMQVGSAYQVLGLMTDATVRRNSQFTPSELKKIKGARSELLEITIREVIE
jgi:hypothetical protein